MIRNPLEAIDLASAALAAHDDELVRAIGQLLRAYGLQGEGAGPLGEAIDLDGRADLVRARRNLAIRDCATRFFAEMPAPMAARCLALALAEYRARVWPLQRARPRCPHSEGSLQARLWLVLTLRPAGLSA